MHGAAQRGGRILLAVGWRRLAVLGLALAVAGWLIAAAPGRAPRSGATGQPAGGQAASGPPPALAKVWPAAKIMTSAGQLPDGADYLPWLYVDANTSVGTAPTPDGTATRLVLRGADGAPREWRRIAGDQYPQFLGFTAAGDEVFWAESTATVDGRSATRIWHGNWRSSSPPALLTVDAGEAVFFNSQFDMVVADGQLHWVSATTIDRSATELRSVPVGGGRVSVRPLPGAFVLSAWPWLVSINGKAGPLDLVNLTSGQQVRVPISAAETVLCSPTWCRVRVLARSGVSRLDLMRPDGSDRHRIAGGTATASVTDVALLDRFEVVTSGDSSAQKLALFDEKTRAMTSVADNAGIVVARGGVLWWSSGEQGKVAQWHALDLTRLA